MLFLPDWNSLPSISRFLSALQITLLALGLFTTVVGYFAYKYEKRKDQLADQKQNAIEQHHSEEIAKLNLETARLKLETANAHERAANLEKEAASARLEQEKLKAKVAWRTLTPSMTTKLSSTLHGSNHSIMIASISNDAESAYFAMQLTNVFNAAGWQTLTQSQTYNGVVTGIFVPDPANPPTRLVRKALSAANISFGTDVVPKPGISFGNTGSTETAIIIGSKPQLFD